MIGSTVLAMPWGFQQSGVIAGIGEVYLVLVFVIGATACYTCSLVLKYSKMKGLEDITDMVTLMWGKTGKYLTLAMSMMIMIGACMVFNVLINSSFFNMLEGIALWASGSKVSDCWSCWTGFSSRYTPFLLFVPLLLLSNLKDKKTYIRINSGGIYCVLITTFFLISVGIRALAMNTFTLSGSDSVSSDEKDCKDDWNCLKHNKDVHISLFEPKFMKLGGILSLSFFLHNCIVIIMKNNDKQEKNKRDLVLGYSAVGFSYLAIGALGYFGFRGNGFPQGEINQNALNMFAPDNVFAFIVRFVVLVQMLTVYPMVLYIVRVQFFNAILGSTLPTKKQILYFSLVCCGLTTIVSSVYPLVGSIAGYTGGICGFYFIYLMPVALHIKFGKPKQSGLIEDKKGMRIAMKEEDMDRSVSSTQNSGAGLGWTLNIALHSLIVVFGLACLIFQFVEP